MEWKWNGNGKRMHFLARSALSESMWVITLVCTLCSYVTSFLSVWESTVCMGMVSIEHALCSWVVIKFVVRKHCPDKSRPIQILFGHFVWSLSKSYRTPWYRIRTVSTHQSKECLTEWINSAVFSARAHIWCHLGNCCEMQFSPQPDNLQTLPTHQNRQSLAKPNEYDVTLVQMTVSAIHCKWCMCRIMLTSITLIWWAGFPPG